MLLDILLVLMFAVANIIVRWAGLRIINVIRFGKFRNVLQAGKGIAAVFTGEEGPWKAVGS